MITAKYTLQPHTFTKASPRPIVDVDGLLGQLARGHLSTSEDDYAALKQACAESTQTILFQPTLRVS